MTTSTLDRAEAQGGDDRRPWGATSVRTDRGVETAHGSLDADRDGAAHAADRATAWRAILLGDLL